MRDLRAWVPAAVLLLGCAGILRTRAQRAMPLVAPLQTIMPADPGYTVKQQRLSDAEQRVAGMSDYVARAFLRDSLIAFSTFVSYYDEQAQGHTIHSPKNCLPGAGWEVMTAGTREISTPDGPRVVNRYVVKNGLATAIVYYWYEGRGRVVANEYRVKWNLLKDAVLLGHTEEALVRVVVPVLPAPSTALAGAASVRADSLGQAVSGELVDEVMRVLPKRHG